MNTEDIIIEVVGEMIENLQIDVNDRLKALEERLTVIDNTNSAILEDVPNQRGLVEFEERIHDRISTLAETVTGITGLSEADACGKGKLETRLAQMEQRIEALDRRYGDNITVIRDCLVEVKGQISNPLRKTAAIDDLRQRIANTYK